MRVRTASPADAEAVVDVFLAARAGWTYVPHLHTDDETREWIAGVVLARDDVWVAEAEGRVAGFAAVAGDMLDHLYVHPALQGQSVGTLLLEQVKHARPAGFRLWVFQRNEAARAFYERRGLRLLELTDGSSNEEREPDALYEWRPE